MVACAVPELLVTAGVEDVEADEVAIEDDRVVPAAVDVKDDVPESTVASATSPALAGLPPSSSPR